MWWRTGCCWSPGGSWLEGAPAGSETQEVGGTVSALPGCLPHPLPGPSLPQVKAKRSAQGILTFSGLIFEGRMEH